MKYIKPINENWEEQVKLKNEKIKKLYNILQNVAVEVLANDGETKTSNKFQEYWDNNADKIILELGLAEKETFNNDREILPKMASLGNNSQVTQIASKAIADKLSVSEFRDFVSWLKIVDQNNMTNKKRW